MNTLQELSTTERIEYSKMVVTWEKAADDFEAAGNDKAALNARKIAARYQKMLDDDDKRKD